MPLRLLPPKKKKKKITRGQKNKAKTTQGHVAWLNLKKDFFLFFFFFHNKQINVGTSRAQNKYARTRSAVFSVAVQLHPHLTANSAVFSVALQTSSSSYGESCSILFCLPTLSQSHGESCSIAFCEQLHLMTVKDSEQLVRLGLMRSAPTWSIRRLCEQLASLSLIFLS